MPGKIRLYVNTIRYLKPGQVFWRSAKFLGVKRCALPGVRISTRGACCPILHVEELDHDPFFMARFSVNELMQDRVCFLHETEQFHWNMPWHLENHSHLWNFNLHYFEYLHPLTKQFLETGDREYLRKSVEMIRGWIGQNPKESGGDGWSAYTISLRLTNWMAYYSAVFSFLDVSFRDEFEKSIHEQYIFLSCHLEKDILGNHYFENLKALVLCALFFDDKVALRAFLPEFRRECQEEILHDGMHFERSPMYHKIVLEGLLRVAVGLRKEAQSDWLLEQLVQDMVSAAYSLERGLKCTPLFNDSGDNVSKSLNGLLSCAERHLGIKPVLKNALPASGYYFFEKRPWRLIVDAGAAGPDYIPGHSHCDAMSFELYRDGNPILVNCGTYAYQCTERRYFRSTEAHNTVQVPGVEQSEIWSTFRLARRSSTRVLNAWKNGIHMEMTDYRGNRIQREITLTEDTLQITDRGNGELQSHLHSIVKMEIESSGTISRGKAMYAPEFGLLQHAEKYTINASGNLEIRIPLE